MNASSRVSVRFARMESGEVLLGLTLPQLVLVGAGLLVAVAAQYASGALGLLLASPLWAGCVAVAVLPVAGRPALDWLPVTGGWLARRVTGATAWRARLRGRADTVVVPGVRELRLVDLDETAAAVWDRRSGTLTAVLRVEGRGLAFSDDVDQESRLVGWGRVLGALSGQPGVARVQVVVRTRPMGAGQVRRWWAEHGLAEASWASRLVADLLADADSHAVRTETLLAIAVRTPGRRTVSPAARTAALQQVAGIADAVRTAGLDVAGCLDRVGLAGALRGAFDPYTAGGRDDVAAPDGSGTLVAGAALAESWDRVRTDSAVHAVFWLRQWPRTDVAAGFLAPLLLAGAHRTWSLTCEPVPLARAMRDIRRAKVEHASTAAQRARLGQVDDQTLAAEAEDVARREADLVAGHGDLRFTGLLVVTAPDDDALDVACTAAESAAAQSMCELRRLVGQQAAALTAAGLPLARATS